MDLGKKKELIYECVRLGMSLSRAFLLAECTIEEETTLEADKDFMRRVEIKTASKERELLELHDQAINTAVKRGESKGIQWRLEKLNPDDFGKVETHNTKNTNMNMDYDMDNITDEEKKRLDKELKILYGGK